MVIELIHNVTLLVALVAFYGLLERSRRLPAGWLDAGKGVLFGLVAVVGMMLPIHYAPGIIYDGRSIVISMAGLFGEPVSAGLAALIAGAYRAWLGGPGVWAGLATIVACSAVGLWFRHAVAGRPERLGVGLLFLFGLVVHLAMLTCQLLIVPWPRGLEVLRDIWLPVLLVFPAATVPVGLLLGGEDRRRRVERDLLAFREFTEKVVQTANVLFVQLDEKGDIVRANDTFERITGYTVAELQGRNWFETLVPRERYPEAWELFSSALAKGSITEEFENPILTRDGRERHILWRNSLVTDEKGRPATISFGIDITELKQLTEELEVRVARRTAELAESNRALEEFVYSVSHDLRAPLRAITGFAEILAHRHRERLDQEGRHYLDNILEAAKNMAALITDLLAFSRLGKGARAPEDIDTGEVVREVLSEMENSGLTRDTEIAVEPILPPVKGSRILLRQAICNLVENALKYRRLDVGHRVEIRGRRKDDRVVIEVSDNGIGISPEHQQKVFDIFQRLHGQEKYQGTGIGLATVRKAARLMDGTVELESVPGRGSTFRLLLPAAGADAPPGGESPAARNADKELEHEKNG